MKVFVEQPLALNGFAKKSILKLHHWSKSSTIEPWILATCVICIGKGKVQTVLTHLSFKIQTIGTDN